MKRISYIRHRISNVLRHPLFSGSLIMVGGNMVVNVVNYAYHLIMGRVLGPVNYGVLASIFSILYLISVVPSSASVSIVKFISSAKGNGEVYSVYRSLSRFVFILAGVTSLVFMTFSPFVAKFLRIENISIVAMVSFVLFFSLITLVNQASSQGLLKFSGLVVPNLVSAVVKLGLGITLVLLGWSVFGAIFAVVVGAVLSYLYSRWFIKRVLTGKSSKFFNLKPFFKYSIPVLVQAFAFTSLFTTDLILVKHFLPEFEAGIYAALSTLGKIIFFAVSPIVGTMFPIVAGRKSRGESYEKVFLFSFVITLAISSLVVVFYWLFPNIAIGVLYGKAYLSAKSDLVWMGIFILFYTLANILVNFSLSLGRTKVVWFPLLIAVLQVVALWFWHGSLLQVIQISLTLAAILFFALAGYLGYNRLQDIYAKK